MYTPYLFLERQIKTRRQKKRTITWWWCWGKLHHWCTIKYVELAALWVGLFPGHNSQAKIRGWCRKTGLFSTQVHKGRWESVLWQHWANVIRQVSIKYGLYWIALLNYTGEFDLEQHWEIQRKLCEDWSKESVQEMYIIPSDCQTSNEVDRMTRNKIVRFQFL